jgi:hypothetical protein
MSDLGNIFSLLLNLYVFPGLPLQYFYYISKGGTADRIPGLLIAFAYLCAVIGFYDFLDWLGFDWILDPMELADKYGE